MELLLDETICRGTIVIPTELSERVGGINPRLKAKQKYEPLLRIANETEVGFEEIQEESCAEPVIVLEEGEAEQEVTYGWQTDCYVIGKYSAELQKSGYFDAAVSGILEDAALQGRYQDTLAFLEKMIGHDRSYYQIDDATRPILIYKGDDICHNVLTVFAEQFGRALERKGERIICFDIACEAVENILQYINQRYKAVIGVQSYLFSIKMRDEVHYVHEYIHGPKFNFIFDHPIWLRSHLTHQYPDFCVLTHDGNYVEFIKKYFHQNAVFFPPAGMVTEGAWERQYDLTFVGTYGDYWEQILWMHQLERPVRFRANKVLLVMRRQPNLTLEEAFAYVLEKDNIVLTDTEFVNQLYEIRRVVYCVMHYYRSKVIEIILKSGIQADVFGDSWYGCPLRKYSNLVCHPDVTVEESLGIWKQSKLSLNVMSWYKGGFTERMAGIMLAGAVLVTDDTSYLHGRYGEEDMLIFRLEYLEELPAKIRQLLDDTKRRERVAENGRRKAEEEHTWDKRAEQFLKLL